MNSRAAFVFDSNAGDALALARTAGRSVLNAVDAGLHPQGCSCGLHGAGVNDPKILTNDASVDPQAGTTAPNGKPIWNLQQITENLNRNGHSWNPGGDNTVQKGDADPKTITFGFFNNLSDLEGQGYTFEYLGGYYGSDEYFNFTAFTAEQRAAARQSLQYWDDVLNVKFVETNSANADINFGGLADAPETQAYAYFPQKTLYGLASIDAQVQGLGGDVWVSSSQASNFQFQQGGYAGNTLTHEIGHAIGLDHPGKYNFGPGFSVNYANGAEYYQDARNYTIMSYWNPRDIGVRDTDFRIHTISYGQTPMLHDIYVAQQMYGADMTTRTGNTTYGFNSNAGRAAFDFTVNTAPFVAIWDAGGNDTLDVSGYNTNQIIDLNPGSLSSIGGMTQAEVLALSLDQVNANRAAAGYAPITQATYQANINAVLNDPFRGRLTDNVGIAYGAIIENAVGGGGNDTIYANAAANRIDGGAGVDTVSYATATSGITVSMVAGTTGGGAAGDRLIAIEGVIGSRFNDTITGDARDNIIGGGIGGNDRMDGGAGIDTLTYADSLTAVTVNFQTSQFAGGAAGDVAFGFENIIGSAFNDTLTGNVQNNVLMGGAGNDVLDGFLGNDTLDGGAGNDTLTGGIGNDIFKFGEANGAYDTITDFLSRVDKIDVSAIDANTAIAGNDAFVFIGSNAFNGTAGQLRFAGGLLQGDVNGDGNADFTVSIGNKALVVGDLVL
ncbi:M10 family metallopeptidase C-terminal domain-containing protein [Sphingomonas sp. Y38-1Y]|uniref:M10 family metallopeptidase C-terminal domain-containing protein n=1 Tax=Sphingomonas sp. Y38-1Y TaxID=3078265 RepID=UPI0028E7972E|nr:M10 family metallopeptidase C-terminal domain-containing protein [Sphingomonas sp. Y38-1Y]